MTLHDWFWQLEAEARGPDWFFAASFAPECAGRLAQMVGQRPPLGFARIQVAGGQCPLHGHTSSYDVYVDQRNYAGLAANVAGEAARNIWIYHTIELCGADLRVERGYGGYPGEHAAAETELIIRLAQDPALTLQAWQVGYGGQGYPPGLVASGNSAAELLAYLGTSKIRVRR